MKGIDAKLSKLKEKIPAKLHYNAYIQANGPEVTYAQNIEKYLHQTKFKLKGKEYPHWITSQYKYFLGQR